MHCKGHVKEEEEEGEELEIGEGMRVTFRTLEGGEVWRPAGEVSIFDNPVGPALCSRLILFANNVALICYRRSWGLDR